MLKNFWYAVEASARVTDKPQKLKVLGQELSLYRKRADGKVVAVSNLCVHRGGALSDGDVDENDCLRCPYHGWRYDETGACVEIPANPKGAAIPRKAHIDKYPVEERYGWVWVFLGDLLEAERPPIPEFPEFGQPGWRAVHGEFTWNAHYTRVVENGIDIAHTPFVHANSFGNREQPEIENYEVSGGEYSAGASVVFTPPLPTGFWKFLRRKRSNVRATNAVLMPNITRIDIEFGEWRTIVYDSNIPVDENTTRTIYIQLRNFFTGAWADGDSRRRVHKIMKEDQRTVESQRPELLPYDLAAELHVKSDANALAYRKLRKKFLDKGWGIDQHLIRTAYAGRSAVVIPSPARRENPELARAWVMPEVPVLSLRRKASNE